jgi:hypothetical protein
MSCHFGLPRLAALPVFGGVNLVSTAIFISAFNPHFNNSSPTVLP